MSNTGTENSSGEEGEIVVFYDSRELTYQQITFKRIHFFPPEEQVSQYLIVTGQEHHHSTKYCKNGVRERGKSITTDAAIFKLSSKSFIVINT